MALPTGILWKKECGSSVKDLLQKVLNTKYNVLSIMPRWWNPSSRYPAGIATGQAGIQNYGHMAEIIETRPAPFF